MSLVHVEQRDAILRIQLNRPEKKNALTPEMYDSIREALNQADASDSIRVVYLTGSGDSFSAGNDLKVFLQNPASDSASRFIKTIASTETPIVAAVNGIAIGVGVTMLLHCDLVYAIPETIFNFAFIDLGVVPEAASSYLVPLLAGQRRASELLLLGEKFGVETAESIGLINASVPSDELESVAWEKAGQLASKPPQALRMTKQLLKRGHASIVNETMDHELTLFADRLQSDEAREIMMRFFAPKQ